MSYGLIYFTDYFIIILLRKVVILFIIFSYKFPVLLFLSFFALHYIPVSIKNVYDYFWVKKLCLVKLKYDNRRTV